MLKGKRIILRAARKKDVKPLTSFMNDQEVISGLTQYLPISEIEEEKWIDKMVIERKRTDIFFVITLKDGRVIGSCGLHKIDQLNQNAEISVVIGKKSLWGKGYGNEASALLIKYAFQQLNLRRLSTGVYAFNHKGAKSLHKLGFQNEGRQRKAIFKNGSFHDILLFGLLKEDDRRG